MFNQLVLLYLAIIISLFLPGYFLLHVLFGQKYFQLTSIEKLLLTFVLSLSGTNFIMLLMNYLHIPLARKNLFISLFAFTSLWAIYYLMTIKKRIVSAKIKPSQKNKFSYRQILIFITILVFSIFLRGVYLSDGIMPRSTDLGHHMYWANYISVKGVLPVYDEKFIIGEHLPFAAINIFSHIPFVSAMPVTILFLFNIFTLLAVFVLARELAISFLDNFTDLKPFSKVSPNDIALWAFFSIGILYPITAPQAKFISGGVVGNIIGNLLLITVIYTFVKAIIYQSKSFASVFLITIITLIYTHHLSTLILAYTLFAIITAFAFLLLIFSKFNFSKLFNDIWKYLKVFINIKTLPIILIAFFLIWQVRTPSYLNPQAIDTAVGTPTKITRVGLNLSGIINRIGSWRVMFSLISLGFILNIFFRIILKTFFWKQPSRNNIFLDKLTELPTSKNILSTALIIAVLIAWAKIIFLMSWKPAWLKVDIPSSRIITYLTYPTALMSGFGLASFFNYLKVRMPVKLFTLLFVFFIGIGLISGLAQDIAENLRSTKNIDAEVMETYLGAIYLAENTPSSEMVLKDHIYLEGDTWMKIFFMRGYKYPLSRTYNRRYEDKYNKHETCTRDMIAIPNSTIGQSCFKETGVKYIFLKKGFDDGVFINSPEFQQVYSSKNVTVFQKQK